jgi:esterase/lipase superfamily enzyme
MAGMLFLTNREPKGSIQSEKNRSFIFDYEKNAPSNSIFCCVRNKKNHYIELTAKLFFAQIKAAKYEQVLFYIHGFSNLPESDIFPRAKQLQTQFNKKKPGLVLVIPIIWPCDNDSGIIKDYWDDQKSADMSAFSFARALTFFMNWRDEQSDTAPCLKRINILAHSMGNRVFRQTLAAWNKYELSNGVPLLFRNSFLVAADIVNESLEPSHDGRFICQASRNVSVYYASDDLALRASKLSNLKSKVASRRLGHSGPEDMRKTPANVYAIDCDSVNATYDMPKGHSYFITDRNNQPGKVFEHIFHAIDTGRVQVDGPHSRQWLIE